MHGLVTISRIQSLKAPQNATLLSAGSHPNTLSNSSGITGSTNAAGIGDSIRSSSVLKSTTMISLDFVRTLMKSPIEIHCTTRVGLALDSGTISSWEGDWGTGGMLSRISRFPNRRISHTANIGAASTIASRNQREYIVFLHRENASIYSSFHSTRQRSHLRHENHSASYASKKRSGGGERNGIRKSKYTTPRLQTGRMRETALSRWGNCWMEPENTGEPGMRRDPALSLEFTTTEASLGSIHNLATEARDEGTA